MAETRIERYDPFDGALGISLATRAGSRVFTSGMVGFDGTTGTVPEDLEDEIRPVFSVFVQALAGPQNHCEVKLVAEMP